MRLVPSSQSVAITEKTALFVAHATRAGHFQITEIAVHQHCTFKIGHGFVGGHGNAQNTQAVGKFSRGFDNFNKFLPGGGVQVVPSRPQQKRGRGAGAECVFSRILRHVGGDPFDTLIQIILPERYEERGLLVRVDGIRVHEQFHNFRAAGDIHADVGQDLAGVAVDALVDPQFIGKGVHFDDSPGGDIRFRTFGIVSSYFFVVFFGVLKTRSVVRRQPRHQTSG